MIPAIVLKSLSFLLALGVGCNLMSERALALAEQLSIGPQQTSANKLVEKCCQIGRERAIESQAFNCKMSARDAFLSLGRSVALGAESILSRDQNLADQCEMVLESCCLALHRSRNCDSGKQFARSGSACMDVELSKEATIATESFNDCCMSCSLGILAARNQAQNESGSLAQSNQRSLNDRCKLISPLASSLSGQLYEQTYIECCQENLPKISSALIDLDGPIDCSQSTNACAQRCLARGSLDPVARRPVELDRCDCFSGFKLAPDGINCVDVDECKQNLHTCNRQSEVCDNTPGSFKCLARSHSLQQAREPGRLASARSLALDDQLPTGAAEHLEQPVAFSSIRLCPLGSRWSTSENRCQQVAPGAGISAGGPNNERHHQHHWNRHSSFSTSSSRRVSSSSQLET